MSDKLRMADVFIHFNGVAVHVNHTAVREEYADGVTPWDMIDIAVREHDTMQDKIAQLESTQEEYAHLLNDIHSLMAKSWQHNFSQKESGDAVRYVSALLETIERERAARERLERDKAELVMLANTLNARLLIDGEYRDSPLRETTDGILAKHKGDK